MDIRRQSTAHQLSNARRGRKNGTRLIQVCLPDGKREYLSLGKCSKRNAETICGHIATLVDSAKLGTALPTSLTEWLSACDESIREKLGTMGLLNYSPPNPLALLGAFLDEYKRTKCKTHKPASIVVWNSVIRNLIIHFGADCPLESITHADCEAFHSYLNESKLRPTTIAKRISHARMFFGYAKRIKLIQENPFEHIKTRGGDVAENRAYVPAETISKIIEYAPDAWWRLLIALARFGGLRVPSEPLSLKWSGIDWAEGRMTVYSPKTEHIAGKAYRTVPLFPALRPFLEECFELTQEGSDDFIFPQEWRERAQGAGGWANANFRTTFEKIIARAGFAKWKRLFHALRASCETDLCGRHSIHVVTQWIGNTPDIALKHYLSVTDADFQKALGETSGMVENPNDWVR